MLLLKKYFLFVLCLLLVAKSLGISSKTLKKNSQLKVEARDVDDIKDQSFTTTKIEADSTTEQSFMLDMKPEPQKIDSIINHTELDENSTTLVTVNSSENYTSVEPTKVEINIVDEKLPPRRKIIKYDQR